MLNYNQEFSFSYEQDVQYSMILDVFDLCTPELQKRLMPMREKIKMAEDAKLDRERAKVFDESFN